MSKKLSLALVIALLAFAGTASATAFVEPPYISYVLAGGNPGANTGIAYDATVGVIADSFAFPARRTCDTWALTKPMYDVTFWCATQTIQTGCWIGEAQSGATSKTKIAIAASVDSMAMFMPGRVDTIFLYRILATVDTAGTATYIALGKPDVGVQYNRDDRKASTAENRR